MFSPLALTTRFRGTKARGKTKGKGKGSDREMGFTLTTTEHIKSTKSVLSVKNGASNGWPEPLCPDVTAHMLSISDGIEY